MSSQNRVSFPDFDTIWPHIQQSAGEVSQQTEWMSKRSGKSALLMVPVFIAGFFFIIALLSIVAGLGKISLIAFSLAIIFAAPSVIYSIKKFNEASDDHSENVVVPMVQRLIEEARASSTAGQQSSLEATYEAKGAMPLSVLSGSGFIRDPRAPQEDLIRGTLGQTDFMFSDVKWQASEFEESEAAKERREKSDKRANRRAIQEKYGDYWRDHRHEDLLNGTDVSSLVPASLRKAVQEKYAELERSVESIGPSMVVFAADFHKDFTSSTYLLPRNRQDQAIRHFSEESVAQAGLEPMTLEDPGINQRFEGWTTDQLEARYLITPQLMLAISDAAERMNSEHIAVSFRGSWMYFAVVLDEDRFNFQIDPNKDGGYTMAKTIYEDLVSFLNLVEDFNLNTRIWSKA